MCAAGQPHETGVTCAAGVCVMSCEAGWGDCNPNNYDSPGCESNLATSSIACGACGKDCGGGLCVGSTCSPPAETVATIPSQAPDGVITHIEVDANNVYAGEYSFLNSSTLSLAPKAPGSAPQQVTTGALLHDFAVGADALLWLTGQVVQKRAGDGTVSTVATLSNNEDARFILTDSSSVWLLENAVASTPTTDASVRVLPKGATATQTVWTQKSGAWVGGLFNGTDLIVRGLGWSGSSFSSPDPNFERISKAGAASAFGALTTIVPFAADSDNVYYGGDALYAVPIGGANAVKLWTPSAGGVFSVAVDSSNVYFAECANDSQPARLRRIPKAGGTADVIASDSIGGYGFAGRNCEFSDNVMFGSTPLRVVALDAGYAYWSNGQHVIRRIAK